MNLLLDTHVLIWFFEGESKLSPPVRALIEDARNKCFVSIASVWEITIKSSLGKLEFARSAKEISQLLYNNGISLLNIEIEHLDIMKSLPHHHRDPFDRLLIAQAISEGLSIISADRYFSPYPVKITWL
ncbi:type II toxin-antitoxin system VapC family toxin [Mucilaginibacter gynuensis]|uniref:Type II toxin-antitoxin system VapC family toxin n=1 Tax=Mucilaginibacter gynuensis TaxID=1302236 RepID=A0ABP8H3R9_9SPHI